MFPGGRQAETEYKRLAIYTNKDFPPKNSRMYHYSLVEVAPRTGRTHQIRVHLRYLDHPIVSDSFYAGGKTYKLDKKWCPRLFLHAMEIEFIHPVSGKEMKFTSELPGDLKASLLHLEKEDVST